MQSMRKKLLSLLLALVMLFQLFPVTALAEDGEDAGEMPQLEETILDPSDWEEPVPVGEDESKREENIKQFRMTDGSWLAATYPLAVHYEENGEWVEIDNRLEEKELEYAVPFPEEGLKEAEELLPEEVLPGDGVGNKEPSTAEEVAPEETAVEEAPEEEGTAEEDPPAEEPTEDGEAADAEEPTEEPVEEPKEEPADEEPSEEPAEDPPAEANQDGEVAVDVIPPEGEEKSSRDDSKPVLENMYVNMQNRFGVSLPVVLNENSWFGVSDNGYRLFFRMVGVQESESVLEKEAPLPENPVERAALVHYNSTVNYPNALPGAELKYDVRGQSLKETIIFPDLGIVPEQVSYQIWAEGMTAEVVEDSEIRFFADGELVFVFPTPFFMDSEGNSDGALTVELEDLGDGCFILRYTPEREWLESEERCWPVMLDPVITNVVNTNYIRDAYIRKGYPTYGGGLFYYFYAGFYSNATKAVRGLVKHTQIPSLESGDVIVGAYLTAHGLVYQSNGTQIQVDAHAITEDWDSQSVKWNNQPAYEEDVLDFQIVNSTADKLYTWDVTSAVQRWYGGVASEKGALANQGFMLISPTENDWNVLMAQFKSSDSSPSSYWPMLYISYRNTTGLESYWDYTSAGAGRAGTVYANNYTGNLVVNRSDMSYSGNRMHANIAFTYNQNDCTTDIGYGKGWRSAYSQQLEQVSISGVTYYKWTDGDGTRIYFHNKDNEWVDENGLSYKLSVGANGYTITDRDENSLGFDVNGRLISVTDKLNNSLSIAYTESGTTNLRISQVTDGAGRVYSFSYSNNLLSSVVYMGAGNTSIETASYTYDGSSLSTVTYADGKAASYSYTGNTLTEARDIQRSSGNCNKLVISYGGTPSKVMGISYYDGATIVNSVSLRYGDHNTIVTDNVERWCSYEFNNLGNTVSVYNQAGQALYGSFATDENPTGRANQLIHSSRLQDTVLNLLDNRSEAGNWSETFTVQSGVPYSLSGVTAVGSTLSMTAGSETLTATSVSSTERTELTIMIPSGVTSLTISGSGNAWDLQLEQTEAASRYNLLSNADMSSSSGWTGTNLGASDGIATVSGSRARLNDSALVMEGSGTSAKSYTQTLSVNGSMGDDYSFGGWVKSSSVPLSNKNDPDSTLERRCGIRVRLLNGSTEVDSKILDANTDCPEWQFLSGSIRANGAYDTVEFSFIYDYNANSSSFDGAQLFREKFAYVYHYDDDGRIDKITDLEGRETTYTYRGTTSDITSITLPGGAQYSYSYTSSGLLQSAVSDTGVTSSYSYDAYGNPTGTSITGGNEKRLTSGTTYTSDGNMTASVTGNDAETVTYTNDTDRSLVLSVTDPAGTVTTNSYDSMRRPVSSQTGSSSITNTYSDDLLTGLSHSNTANSSTQYTLGYTTADLLYSVQIGSIYTLVQNSYNAGTWTLARQDYGNGAGWAYSYNEFDQVTARWTTNGTTGVEFRYFYNSEGALARVEQHETTLSSGSITDRTLVNTERYYYDTGDRLIRVWETDANGNQHEFRWTYDSNDQVTELVETVNGQSFTYANSYNGDKQPTQSSYGNVLEGFTYDGLGRMSQTAVSNSGSNVLTTDYTFRDLDSNRTTTQVEEIRNRYGLTDEAISYTYDSRGNIASVSFPWTVTVPDPEPTPTPTPDPTPTPTPTPDPTPTPTPTPDPTPTPTPGGNGNHGDWEIDPDAPFLPILPTPTPDAEFNSGTQGNGSSGGVATTITVTIYYEYDALNELVWEKSELEEKAWNYSYDLGGNILSKTEYSYQNGTVGSTVLSTVTYTYGDANWPDLLTTYNGSPITYDGLGNPLSYRGWTFTWQGGRQLASASDGTSNLRFVYNESGLRTEKTVGNASHRYVYRGSTLVAEITDDYALFFHHDALGEIVGFTYASGSTQTEYFYCKNLQGDVIGIVDSTGASVAEYRYDAWGQILDASGTMATVNPIRYRGYYFDGETGLYYLQSRYYDPVVGRFINSDAFASTGQGILGCNMFAYCGNNAVNYSDYRGNLAAKNIAPFFGLDGSGKPEPPDITEELDELMRKHAKELINYFRDAVERANTGYEYASSGSIWLSVPSVAFFDTLGFFIEKVRTGGDWDLKNNIYPSRDQFMYNGMIYDGEDIGNIHFGYVGAALYTSGFLHFGAGVYQICSGSKWEYWSTLFDEPRDSEMIEYGIKLYEGR